MQKYINGPFLNKNASDKRIFYQLQKMFPLDRSNELKYSFKTNLDGNKIFQGINFFVLSFSVTPTIK